MINIPASTLSTDIPTANLSFTGENAKTAAVVEAVIQQHFVPRVLLGPSGHVMVTWDWSSTAARDAFVALVSKLEGT